MELGRWNGKSSLPSFSKTMAPNKICFKALRANSDGKRHVPQTGFAGANDPCRAGPCHVLLVIRQ